MEAPDPSLPLVSAMYTRVVPCGVASAEQSLDGKCVFSAAVGCATSPKANTVQLRTVANANTVLCIAYPSNDFACEPSERKAINGTERNPSVALAASPLFIVHKHGVVRGGDGVAQLQQRQFAF